MRFWWFLILWRARHQLRGDSNLMKEKETEVNILRPRCRRVFLDLDFPIAWIYNISTPGTLLGKQRSWPFHLGGCEERLHSLVVLLCLSPENHSYVPFKYLPSCQECNFWELQFVLRWRLYSPTIKTFYRILSKRSYWFFFSTKNSTLHGFYIYSWMFFFLHMRMPF